MPSLVNTEATKDMGGGKGMQPDAVAEPTLNGVVKADSFEIYVGDTAVQRNAYFANPIETVESFNQGL